MCSLHFSRTIILKSTYAIYPSYQVSYTLQTVNSTAKLKSVHVSSELINSLTLLLEKELENHLRKAGLILFINVDF